MKKMDKTVNAIKIGLANKKQLILIKINSKEMSLIKIFLKLNVITFVKKINKSKILIKLNNDFKLKLTNILKKKKLSIKKQLKKTDGMMFIVSTSKGLIINNNTNKCGGLLLLRISY